MLLRLEQNSAAKRSYLYRFYDTGRCTGIFVIGQRSGVAPLSCLWLA